MLGLTSLFNLPNPTEFLFRLADYNKILTYVKQLTIMFVISGFRREVDENCAVLGYYASRRTQLLAIISLRNTIYEGVLISP